jgi:hypothetical protein
MNTLVAMNSTMANIEAILVIVVNVALLEKPPNTYPMINTIQATNKILNTIIPKNITQGFIVIK